MEHSAARAEMEGVIDKENSPPARPPLSLWRRRVGSAQPTGSSPHIARTSPTGSSAPGDAADPRPALAVASLPPTLTAHPVLDDGCGRTPCNTPSTQADGGGDAADAAGSSGAAAAVDLPQSCALPTADVVSAIELAPALERLLRTGLKDPWASPRRGVALHRDTVGLRKHVLQLRAMATVAAAVGDADARHTTRGVDGSLSPRVALARPELAGAADADETPT